MLDDGRRRTPAQSRSRASVDAVIVAAAELLVSEGPARATTNRIAKRAGVSVGTLYQYFDDKDAVFDAVAERMFEEVLTQVGEVTEGSLSDRLRRMCGILIDLMRRWPGVYRALDALPSARCRERFESLRHQAARGGQAMLESHPTEHSAVDPAATARMCVLLADGLARSHGPDDDPSAIGGEVLDHLMRLVGAHAAAMDCADGTVHTLSTPALVLDRARLARNLDRMAHRARHLGVRLRPHIKTTKSVHVARLAVGPGGPLTVSTLREAEHFADHGFTDLVYAVAIVPDRLDRVARLTRRGVRVQLFVENIEVAGAIAAHSAHFETLVEVDSGEDRTGVQGPDDLLAIARVLHASPHTTLRGVATHGGHSYGVRSHKARVAIAEQERSVAVGAAQTLRQAGLPCPIVSVGSTPTAVHAAHLQGVTELRPGVYTLGDLFQAGIGSQAVDDIACSVLATVLSHRRASGRLIIDAGGLALSKDRSTAGWPFDAGYGLLADAVTGEVLEGLRVDSVHQEHGEVVGPIPWDRFPVGARVRVLPNHICMTAASYDRYHVLDGADVTAVWPRINGWHSDG